MERTRALLREGADLHLKPSVGATSPLERAQQLAPGSTAASIVVRAAGPWSVDSHALFPDVDRVWMAVLVHSLYHTFACGEWIMVAGRLWILRGTSCRSCCTAEACEVREREREDL